MEAMRQEMGMHMGKIEGIWIRTNCNTPQGEEAKAANLAISFSRITNSREIKPPTQRKKVLK
jgi:hypothetical protein